MVRRWGREKPLHVGTNKGWNVFGKGTKYGVVS